MPDDWSFETAHAKLSNWMSPFAGMFTAPPWQRVLVLLIGAVLSPGRRTVAAALRVTGLDQDTHFTNYHRVLNRGRWSSRRVARCLFRLLVDTFIPSGPVIVGLDDTLERRWGAKIAAHRIYCDPTRSSHGHFVKASGLRWLSVMVLPEIAWAGRVWAELAKVPAAQWLECQWRDCRDFVAWIAAAPVWWYDAGHVALQFLGVGSRGCLVHRFRGTDQLCPVPAVVLDVVVWRERKRDGWAGWQHFGR